MEGIRLSLFVLEYGWTEGFCQHHNSSSQHPHVCQTAKCLRLKHDACLTLCVYAKLSTLTMSWLKRWYCKHGRSDNDFNVAHFMCQHHHHHHHHHFHQQAYWAKANLHQPSSCSIWEHSQISGHDSRCQTQMEAACKKKGRTYTEIQKNVLVNGSLFCPICI